MNNTVGTIFRYQLQFLPFVCLIKKERKKERTQDFGINSARPIV